MKTVHAWFSILGALLSLTYASGPPYYPTGPFTFPNGTRNKWMWPFTPDSIWNTPIGSGAKYVDSGFTSTAHVSADPSWLVATAPSDPQVPWHKIGSWTHRCNTSAEYLGMVHFPQSVVIPDASAHNTPNNQAAMVQPDGHTIIQTNPIARCQSGGPVFGYLTPGEHKWNGSSFGNLSSLYGPGLHGGCGATGLSSLGGALRLGELDELGAATGPINHTLRLEVWGHQWLDPVPCFRWPALRCDGYAKDPSSKNAYNGSNPALVMGSLLAVPPGDLGSLMGRLQTHPARKMAQALADFGGLITDDTAWDDFQFGVEAGMPEAFQAKYNMSMSGHDGPWYEDLQSIFSSLKVVDNNRQQSPGGGGEPRRPRAPPIGN